MAKFSMRLARENVMRLLVCLGALLVAFALLVYPEMRAITQVEEQILSTQARIEKQKILFPVYRDLLDAYHNATLDTLPRVARKPLAQAEMGGVATTIAGIAREQGLDVRSVTPNPDTLAAGDGLIQVRCTMSGDLAGLRNFYLSLGTLPSLAHVERLQVEDTYAGRLYRMDIWLALENQGKRGGAR